VPAGQASHALFIKAYWPGLHAEQVVVDEYVAQLGMAKTATHVPLDKK